MKGKEYLRPRGANWWLEKRSYTLFMLRELTALFVAGYAAFLLVLVYHASQGAAQFGAFVQELKSPASMALHALTLVAVLYHLYTWFSLTPKIAVLWRGEERVAAPLIVGSQYVAWIVVSLIVAGLAVYAGHG
jgi:succinate dehydrogenase subunit C